MKTIEQHWSLVKAHFEIEGVHWFPGVDEMLEQQKEDEKLLPLLDVSYLKYPHRHIFKFDVKVEVNHDDRDIEFIQLGRLLKQGMLALYPPDIYGCSNFQNRSCEMLAQEVVNLLVTFYPSYYGMVLVEVSEDGENSAITKFDIVNAPDIAYQVEATAEVKDGTD